LWISDFGPTIKNRPSSDNLMMGLSAIGPVARFDDFGAVTRFGDFRVSGVF
jgi:hypothetical protein